MLPPNSPISRRQLLIAGAAAATSAVLTRSTFAADAPATTTSPATNAAMVHPLKSTPRYKIAASDWMMLKRQKPGALPLAKDCGLDGVEVDMGPLGNRPDFEDNLKDEKFRSDYLAQAKTLGLEIASLAMSAFYGQTL